MSPTAAFLFRAAASGQRLLAVEENATNDRQQHKEACLVMAVNEGGFPPILAQQHYTQRSAFAPENLLRETCGQQQITRSGIITVLDHDGGRVDCDFEKGELDGSHDALKLIVTAAELRRSRLSP